MSESNSRSFYSPVDIVEAQSKYGFWGWNLWRQPIGFLVFLISSLADFSCVENSSSTTTTAPPSVALEDDRAAAAVTLLGKQEEEEEDEDDNIEPEFEVEIEEDDEEYMEFEYVEGGQPIVILHGPKQPIKIKRMRGPPSHPNVITEKRLARRFAETGLPYLRGDDPLGKVPWNFLPPPGY